MVFTTTGTQLYHQGTPILLVGVNDTTVLQWCHWYVMKHQYWQNYLYSNHNFPEYTGDPTTKIPATSYREFWWKYFWLLRNACGGYLTTKAGTFYTRMNHLRLGAAGPSDIGDQYLCFKNFRSENNKLMSDLLDMAQANECYVTINMGGGGEEASTDLGAGPIKVVHTEAFNNYVQYCADFINAYGTHEAIAMFDLFNEPNNFGWDGRSTWWVAQYGTELVYLEPPNETVQAGAWEAAYMIWKNALITEVKAKVTLNPRPLITIGDTRPFINYWNDQATVDAAVARMLRWVENYDVMIGHGYGAAEDDYLVHWNLRNAVTANMPSYEEEFGYGPAPYVPPYYSYWPWRDQMFQRHGINSCSMVLWEWPDGTGSGVPQAAYPGYPIPQSVMDSIPPMPGGVITKKHSPTASAYGSPSFY